MGTLETMLDRIRPGLIGVLLAPSYWQSSRGIQVRSMRVGCRPRSKTFSWHTTGGGKCRSALFSLTGPRAFAIYRTMMLWLTHIDAAFRQGLWSLSMEHQVARYFFISSFSKRQIQATGGWTRLEREVSCEYEQETLHPPA